MEEGRGEPEIADLNMYLVPAEDEEEAMASDSEKAGENPEDLQAEIQQVAKELSASTPKARRVLQSEDVFTPESDHGDARLTQGCPDEGPEVTSESSCNAEVAPVNLGERRIRCLSC
eukprot:760701-Hanusia_phi.AAC.2